jgi:hypothetical protein
MVLCSSRDTLSLKKNKKKIAGPPVYYARSTRSNEPIHIPKFEWPDNTFKQCFKSERMRIRRQAGP